MRNKLIKLLMLMLVVAVVLTAVVACNSNENTDPPGTNDGQGDGNEIETPTINKSVIFADIKNGLVNAGERVAQTIAGTRYVTSEYTLIVDNVNVNVNYDANYDISRPEDSEIMLCVYDHLNEKNTVFVYYKDKTLYYAVGDKRVEMPGFGSTASFEMFYEIITWFDMGETLYSEDFANDIESLSSFAVSDNITRLNIDENTDTITVRDINLDRLKGTVNDYITNNITSLGTKLDALSNYFLGFNVSDLGKTEIGLFNATRLMVVLDKLDAETYAARSFDIVFDGTQSNNISRYYLSAAYSSVAGTGKVDIPREVDPSLNTDYDSERYGQAHLTGTVYVPALDAEFYLDAKGDLNTEDNSLNKYAVVLTNRQDADSVVAASYYVNGRLYVDLEGLTRDYLGNIADYEALGMPKTVFYDIDLAKELGNIVEDAVTMLATGIEIPSLGDTEYDNEQLNVILSKIRSENGVFYITVDSEFLSEVLGASSTDIADYIATLLGVDSAFVDEILGLGIADDLVLELAFDTATKGIGAVLYSDGEEVLSCDLTLNDIPDSGLTVEVPSEAELAGYKPFGVPDTVVLEIDGEFSAQGKEFNDISAFMGIFVGDVTGKNTPCTLKVSDMLTVKGKIWQTADDIYFSLEFAINGEVVLTFVSDPADAEKIYIDNRLLGVKYVLAREVLLDGVSALTGNDDWDTASLAAMYEMIASDATVSLENDYVLLKLVSQKSEEGGNPLLDLFKLESMVATLRLRVDFTAPDLAVDVSEYHSPVITVYDPASDSSVTEVRWESIYEAVWYDTAAVTIGDETLILQLTYTEESVTLVTGVYEYHPVAELFGQTVTYTMYFLDTVSGISVVRALESYSMVIDPSAETPFAETVRVIYDNGLYGELPYSLEYKDGTPFPYDNGNASLLLQGLAPETYVLVIGKGSIAEIRFEINMTVLGRTIKVGINDYYNDIPIVARVTIDPYDYSLKKAAANAAGIGYYPIRYRADDPATPDIDESSTLYITFNSYPGSNATETIALTEFDWGFNESLITFTGGEKVVVAKYQTLSIALVVTISAKEVDYIKINSENNGYYTVDSLVTSTYTIPTYTTATNEVRIYFKSGHYRIIGTEPQEGASADPMCDGYYDIPLAWNYPVADYVTIDRSVNPLNNGKSNEATAAFGDDIAGLQEVTVRVVCPTRVIGQRAESVVAVTSVTYDDNGDIIDELTAVNPVRASLASFTSTGTVDGSCFYFDPYSQEESNIYLPKSVFVSVEYQGVTALREYPVRWITGLNGANDNIVTEDGRIINAFAEETYMRVYGVIGDGELTQTLTMLVLNRSGAYESVVMLNGDETPFEGVTEENGRYYLRGLNPYDELVLPDKVMLVFDEGSGIPDSIYSADWYTESGIPAAEFVASPQGGEYVFVTGIAGGSDTGMLDQTIELRVIFDKKVVQGDRIYGLVPDDSIIIDTDNRYYVSVDTYSAMSAELYDKLDSGFVNVDIGFDDGTRSQGVEIEWSNLNEFLGVLLSPAGSSEYYAGYAGGLIELRGVIKPGTVLEQEVSLAFRVEPRVITGMNFNNLSSDFTSPDENNVIAVESDIEFVRYAYDEQSGTVKPSGNNVIDLTFNKFYALRGTYVDDNGITVTGLCTPKQYVDYLFGAVALSFSDSAMVNAAVYSLRDDLNDFVYGHKTPSDQDTDVTVTDNYVIVTFVVEKLTEGSCVQSFTVNLRFLRDALQESDYSIGIETFDENGNPLYETQEGYLLPDTFEVRYLRSGTVEYDDLVWTATATETGANGAVIGAGQSVTNIRYEFFMFAKGRNMTLQASLPGGQTITLRLNFYKKDVGLTGYSTADEGLYKITDGTLVIENAYDVMPVENIPANLSTVIVPKTTAQFVNSEYNVSFTLTDGWKPSETFADELGNFSAEKLRKYITSAGVNRLLFATGTIRGYNGETQTIELYIEVAKLENGYISHSDYDISYNNLTFDQYASDSYDGTLVLPKDIKVTFTSVSYQFGADADVKYELRDKNNNFTEVTALTYNSLGHTMGEEYGAPNAGLYMRVTLPDGNSTLNLTVVFPNRTASGVQFLNKSNTGSAAFVDDKYYIDPYDSATFVLPDSVRIFYEGASEGVDKSVVWTPYGERAQAAFELTSDGRYRYAGADHEYGAEYLFYTVLKNFDDADKAQYLVMHVVVIERTVIGLPTEIMTNRFHVENPFIALVKDIPSALDAGYFMPLEGISGVAENALDDMNALLTEFGALANVVYDDEAFGSDAQTFALYADYLAVSAPVVPYIKWYKETGVAGSGEYELLTDDDISVLGGISLNLVGMFTYGEGEAEAQGRSISVTLTSDTWEFSKILGITDNVIEFNPYTLTSLAESFQVEFFVRRAQGDIFIPLTFYPEYYADTEDKLRSVILFNKSDWSSNETSSVSFVNTFKTSDANRITTDAIYSLDAQQIGIDEISFGFGAGFAVSGQVELVIDPLNPVIPDTALARGKVLTSTGEIVHLDEVNVLWESSVYDIPIAGGTRAVSATVSKEGESAEIVVQVTYLNRSTQGIYTTERGFTAAATPVDNYFTLMLASVSGTGEVRNHYMLIDPINSTLYVPEGANAYYTVSGADPARSSYKLPSTLRLTFANDYPAGSTAALAAEKLGKELYLSEVKWLLSRDITLTNTSGPITAKIVSFRVSYEYEGVTYTSGVYDYFDDSSVLGSQLDLQLSTTDRRVEYTSISAVPEGSDIDYQQAFDEYYIDPYDIKFPESISIKFTGSSVEETYTGIVWEYDEDYLARTDVISGAIGDELMFVTASMQVYGTRLDIQFSIKARNIDITVPLPGGGTTTQPLSGGTLYVRKGVPIEEQLPTKLYYRFDYADNTTQIAAVPLSFAAANLPNIDNVEAGMTYTNIRGTLGTVDEDNVTFTIIVIDPKLYAVNEETSGGNVTGYSNGGFYYDYIPIGVNRAGQYVAGPETSTLPDKVVVTDEGAYLDIVSVEYDVENLVAIFNCTYTFLSFSDSQNLSGDAEGNGPNSDKMSISFTVPIRTYDYTTIEARSAEFKSATVRFPLGQTITSSDMPLTVTGIAPLWSMQNVNRNRAGEYEVSCSFKNAYGEIITGSMTVIVEKQQLTADDITWTTVNGVNFLNRIYTGEALDITEYFTIKDFLREDGSYGPVQNFSVQYSIDGGISWQDEQPVAVRLEGSPEYRVRILIREEDDYNVTGYYTYYLVINKCEIYAEDIYFHTGDDVPIQESDYEYATSAGTATVKVKQVTYTYNGAEQYPMIGGVPKGATYELIYAEYDPESTNPAYNPVLRPINVGDYLMRMTFVEDQRNYTMNAGMEFTIVVRIAKPDINYTLQTTMDYNGEYRDAVVLAGGVPFEDPGVTFEFTYTPDGSQQLPQGSKIRDAGNYIVKVKIDGGQNYPDGVLNDVSVTIVPREIKISVNRVESEYLEELKPFDSAITVVSANNPEEAGLVGTDTPAIFGAFDIAWTGGTLTYKHMVGSYELDFATKPSHKNYVITTEKGSYEIVARTTGAVVISDKNALDAAVAQLRDGDTVRWYLTAGNYGSLTISKNASVAIVGSYDLTSDEERIAVIFDSVTIAAGDVTLDIISFTPKASSSSVYVGAKAGAVTVSRSEFVNSGATVLIDSVGVRAQTGYSGTVEIKESYFYSYSTAVYLESGAVNISDSGFYFNNMGVNVASGDITLSDNSFVNTKGPAVYIGASDSEVSIFDNVFKRNNVAIKTNTPLRNDIRVQNEFAENAVTFEGWSDEE